MTHDNWFWICLVALGLLALASCWLLWRRTRRRRKESAAPPERIPLKHPVVLVQGIFGFDTIRFLGFQRAYFRGISEHLQLRGVDVRSSQLPLDGTIAERAERLAEWVSQFEDERVILIGHSMGGLDARYAVSRLGLAERVACMVTVGSPHRGTPIADELARGTINVFVRLLQRILAWLGVPSGAVSCLTTEAMAHFNKQVPDVSGVDYFSVVGAPNKRHLGLNVLLCATAWYLRRHSGANDGLVPATSQRWGHVLCEIDANHWAQIGWSRSFDATRFFERLMRDLSRRGY